MSELSLYGTSDFLIWQLLYSAARRYRDAINFRGSFPACYHFNATWNPTRNPNFGCRPSSSSTRIVTNITGTLGALIISCMCGAIQGFCWCSGFDQGGRQVANFDTMQWLPERYHHSSNSEIYGRQQNFQHPVYCIEDFNIPLS